MIKTEYHKLLQVTVRIPGNMEEKTPLKTPL